MREERLEVSVTFVPAKGYVASAPKLRSPVTALSLGGLRRRIEALLLPDVLRGSTLRGQLQRGEVTLDDALAAFMGAIEEQG
jgi:hypothetical protein